MIKQIMKIIIFDLLMSNPLIASAHQLSADSLTATIVPNSVALIIVSAVVFILSLIAIDLLEKTDDLLGGKTNKLIDSLLIFTVFILIILPFAAIGYAVLYCKWLAGIEIIVLLIYFMPCWHDKGGGDGDWSETIARDMFEN